MKVTIKDSVLRQAAAEGMDAFLAAVVQAVKQTAGGELTAESMQQLTADQITLWGYDILHEEVMDGGFIQLIYNGYGPFFFDNPFAKAMRLWGLNEFSKVLYKAKNLYDERKDDLTRERTDEEFMALFENNEEFDELDDYFVENEEDITAAVACYVDDHLDSFVEVEAD
ncbi:uncharacterized protein BN805_01434 [Prevotella sp. CAG:891]|jgi:hypothetical protein|nr:DMP19 family protein [Prevotellamassilia sp.]CDE86758.1 uncharacterized protein BN805_01434 [Prevotella sp. CAG:891]